MRTALVTGTSTGIGQVIAFALARAGYDLAVTELDTDTLSETLRPSCPGAVKSGAASPTLSSIYPM